MMSEETRREIDQLREEIRSIGAALRQLREDLSGVDRIKTGPQGEIDLEAWDKAEGVREEIRVVLKKRDEVQARLNNLLRPFRAARVVPALRESGGTVKQLITEVRGVGGREVRDEPRLPTPRTPLQAAAVIGGPPEYSFHRIAI